MRKSSRYVEKKISADSCHFVDKKNVKIRAIRGNTPQN